MTHRRRTWRLALGIASTVACAGGAACSGNTGGGDMPVPIGIDLQNFDRLYQVHGRTSGALLAEMRGSGPMSQGRRYFGTMTWTLRYRWSNTSPGLGTCSVHGIEVAIQTITTMPEWRDADSASTELRTQWDGFVAALRTHEEGHRRIALEAAIAVKRRLEDLGIAECSSYAREADLAFRRLLDTYNARDVEYDRTTGHGVTQGAIWPPRPSGASGP